MLGTASEIMKNTKASFSYGHLHIDTPVLVYQLKNCLRYLWAKTRFSLDDIPGAMED